MLFQEKLLILVLLRFYPTPPHPWFLRWACIFFVLRSAPNWEFQVCPSCGAKCFTGSGLFSVRPQFSKYAILLLVGKVCVFAWIWNFLACSRFLLKLWSHALFPPNGSEWIVNKSRSSVEIFSEDDGSGMAQKWNNWKLQEKLQGGSFLAQ